MELLAACSRFLQSRSGRGFLLHLVVSAVLAVAVACGFYYSSLNWFKEHKSNEKVIALQLVDAFVTNYSAIRSQFGPNAPVPATFRAHSIDLFNKNLGSEGDFRLRWVGREGFEIVTPPADDNMARTIEGFATEREPTPVSQFVTVGDQLVFRTVYPSLAREQSCVDCHNGLQGNRVNWHLNDVMGAFAIDVPVAPFMRSVLVQSTGIGFGLFLALTLFGLVASILHYRQMHEREVVAAELSRTRSFLHTIIDHMPAIISAKDARTQCYVLVNRAASRLFGISPDGMLGKRVHQLFAQSQADEFMARDQEALDMRGAPVVHEHLVHSPAVGDRILATKKLAITGEDGESQYLISLSEDVTERKRAEEQVAHLAHHDPLTGLPNRAAFSRHLEATLQSAKSESFAVLWIDLDRFKEVNDVFGHTVGDGLLEILANRLQGAAEGAFVARLGGDEFAMITPCGPQPAGAQALADRLHAAAANDIMVDGHALRTGLSIGVAIYPTDGRDAETLLSNSDAALYRSKAEGRGKTRFFEIEMDHRLRERRALQHDLRSALSRGEIRLHYQPQALLSGKVIGMEALARWHHPTLGMVPPGTFIPLAEESGLIIPIGEWILREACREAASWPTPLHIAVNLSPIQFRHGDLVGMVHAVLLETGLPADRLELEITEGVLVEDFARGLSVLRRLKALGVRVAMDDFGTGYSSLSYLQSFPFDKIKIDRSFISNVDSNAQSAAIVCAVIALARGLHLPVLAEGVETAEQLAFLSKQACDEVQGYLLGRPRPIDDYGPLIGRPASADDERRLA